MRGAFGKPCGTVARVHIGQPIISVRTKMNNENSAKEALRRAKFKFPGRQKVVCAVTTEVLGDSLVCLQIFVSKKWGFTKWDRNVYEQMRADGELIPDGVGVQHDRNRGPFAQWIKQQ